MGIFRCKSPRMDKFLVAIKTLWVFTLVNLAGQSSGMGASLPDSTLRSSYVAVGVNFLPFLNGSGEIEAEWRVSKRVSITASGLRSWRATFSNNTRDNAIRRTTTGWATGLGIRFYPLRSNWLFVGLQAYRLSFEQKAFSDAFGFPPSVQENDGALTWGLAASLGTNVTINRRLDLDFSLQVGDVYGRKEYLNFFVPGLGINGRYYVRLHLTPRFRF